MKLEYINNSNLKFNINIQIIFMTQVIKDLSISPLPLYKTQNGISDSNENENKQRKNIDYSKIALNLQHKLNEYQNITGHIFQSGNINSSSNKKKTLIPFIDLISNSSQSSQTMSFKNSQMSIISDINKKLNFDSDSEFIIRMRKLPRSQSQSSMFSSQSISFTSNKSSQNTQFKLIPDSFIINNSKWNDLLQITIEDDYTSDDDKKEINKLYTAINTNEFNSKIKQLKKRRKKSKSNKNK